MEEQAAKKRELLNLKSRLPQLDRECQKDERKIVEELTIETVCLPHPLKAVLQAMSGNILMTLRSIPPIMRRERERSKRAARCGRKGQWTDLEHFV